MRLLWDVAPNPSSPDLDFRLLYLFIMRFITLFQCLLAFFSPRINSPINRQMEVVIRASAPARLTCIACIQAVRICLLHSRINCGVGRRCTYVGGVPATYCSWCVLRPTTTSPSIHCRPYVLQHRAILVDLFY
jgi:hypothetical protein